MKQLLIIFEQICLKQLALIIGNNRFCGILPYLLAVSINNVPVIPIGRSKSMNDSILMENFAITNT